MLTADTHTCFLANFNKWPKKASYYEKSYEKLPFRSFFYNFLRFFNLLKLIGGNFLRN